MAYFPNGSIYSLDLQPVFPSSSPCFRLTGFAHPCCMTATSMSLSSPANQTPRICPIIINAILSIPIYPHLILNWTIIRRLPYPQSLIPMQMDLWFGRLILPHLPLVGPVVHPSYDGTGCWSAVISGPVFFTMSACPLGVFQSCNTVCVFGRGCR